MSGLQLLFYFALAALVVGTGYKVVRIARMPLHLRWDLYPVPHERGKGRYGGSYYEEVDWWTKKVDTTLVGEIREMAGEILALQSLFRHNRQLWIFSFPFHLGLYLLVGFVLLLGLGGAIVASGGAVAPEGGGFGALVYYVTGVCGTAGALLVMLGAVGLFVSRLASRDLRSASVRTDYFNLLLLSAVGATLAATGLGSDSGFHQARAFVQSLLTFSNAPALSDLMRAHLILAAAFMCWLPLTHMTHFVGKYFTYHKVRWEDHPNIRGSRIEAAVAKALGYPLTWSAPHVGTGATWGEAAAGPDDEEKEQK
ncbi:MAG TPA: respiratory nitrate reductase subunit gamma [candidate division Zixibacteria bacterium]|nr:respiratory nitrate reductase subunit gamma [candidate division Zixibacteria bacterium]MDD4916978.1 respiratory nitrate reductase subunit gamma [candidate division Zixibacteria bacterium]MDM7972631.1 respiratory nitrate reductase subunit gamma [candidate division Zixibacteria bacterium]HOD67016.1 respiratory nitrate reductase subunit gamma [candidate division Zixibacteria bacterium]HOZ06774.1 respiratory nitrate reductase subunit gamma [candidate division Zixibacteria bacterium]